MHLIVEPDIRNGVNLMKYAINHPAGFRNVVNPDGKTKNSCHLIPPFFLGFTQAIIAIAVEISIMLLLSTMNDIMLIIMKFASFAAVIHFDNFYAESLFESKMAAAGGKKLKTEFHRYMIW